VKKFFLARRGAAAGVLAVFVLALAYACWVEPYWLRVREVVVADDALRAAWGDVRILHLSDLHIDRIGRRERRLLRIIRRERPDVIVMTGDISQWGAGAAAAVEFTARLSAPLGVYGVLGDADDSKGREKCLFCHLGNRYDVRLKRPFFLQNEVVDVPLAGGVLRIAGIVPAADGRFPPDMPLPRERPLLVLHHFGEIFARLPSGVKALVLAGNTHGGQVWLPAFLRKLLRVPSDFKHPAGLFRGALPGRWLYVNQGVGVTARFPFRFGVRPEAVFITFAPGGAGDD